MGWTGTFVLGRFYATYFGKVGGNTLHEHAAIQLVLSIGEDIAVSNERDECFTGSCILIRPLALHALRGTSDFIAVYIEPGSALGKALLRRVGPQDISVLPDEPGETFANFERDGLLERLDDLHMPVSEGTDRRLSKAIDFLTQTRPAKSITEAASATGVSTSTLRTLARRELGLPLSTWLIWRKLGRAVKALSLGAAISEAALEGGFSDQAHFSRTMKRMFGVTPTVAKFVVKWRPG